MRKCNHCGITEVDTRIIKYKNDMDLCRKHYLQIYRHGEFIERTIYEENDYQIKDNYVLVNLYDKDGNCKAQTIIDKEDLHLVEGKKLYESRGYVRINEPNGKKSFLHRLIMKCPCGKYVDHINHDTLDNRKCNLRIVTKQKNSFNIEKSIYKGVRRKRQKFYATIMKNYKTYWLGIYEKIQEALYARHYAETIMFGENRDKTYEKNKLEIIENIHNKEMIEEIVNGFIN